MMKKTLMSVVLGVAVLSAVVGYADPGVGTHTIQCPAGQYLYGVTYTNIGAYIGMGSYQTQSDVTQQITPLCKPVIGNQAK